MMRFSACIGCGESPLDSSKGDNITGLLHKECQWLLKRAIAEQRRLDELQEIRYLWKDSNGKLVEKVLTKAELKYIKTIQEN